MVDYGKFRDPATRAFTISWDTFIKDRYIYIMHRNIDEINCIVQFNHILVHGCSALFDIGEILLKSSSKLRFYPVSVEMKSFCVF